MNLSLGNLFRGLTGRSRPRPSSRPARTTRLQLEPLDERAVPTANIANHFFSGPGWTLYVTKETFVPGGANFAGIFADTTPGPYHGVNVPISGEVIDGNNGWDYFQFQGTGTAELTFGGIPIWEKKETVFVNGYLNQPGTEMQVGGWWQSFSMWTPLSGWQWEWDAYGNTPYEVAGYGYSF